MKPSKFQYQMLTWFDLHGRKHLPWQQNKTAYRVWISEIMLQQTQVNTVIPYFERFMQSLPNLLTLANATEDEVLHLWTGLGYYSRARNLHRTAKIIVEKFAGKFPNTLEHLTALPGIGPSTAGAILAIAFNQCATILDGNVKRVLARFHGITQPINEKNIEKKLWELATIYTPKQRVADYTQAMMDLGATVCIRSKPQCTLCPLIKNCTAYVQNITTLIPQKKIARILPIRAATLLILKKDKQILLRKRPPTGVWGGLWSLPEMIDPPDKAIIQRFCLQHFQIAVSEYQTLTAFRHTFSHYHLDIFPILINIRRMPRIIMEDEQQIWYNLNKPQSVGLPKPIQMIMETLA